MPSSVEVEVWGLVKALSLIFENDNVEEVWSQSSLKLKKILDENVWGFRWWSLKLKKFYVNEVWKWSLNLRFGAFVSHFGFIVIFGGGE